MLDTYAIIAVLREETDADRYIDALTGDVTPRPSAANCAEASIVVDANGDPVTPTTPA